MPPFIRSHSGIFWRAMVLGAMLVIGSLLPAWAQENPSGLPLPRFVSTRSEPINVRVGPGTKYEISWVYLKAGQPVQIIAEFDTWRKILDIDGDTGWIHQNLLSGTRTGIVQARDAAAQTTLFSNDSLTSHPRAVLQTGLMVKIHECDGTVCEITASHTPPGGRSQSYSGYVAQADLWGALPGEVFD